MIKRLRPTVADQRFAADAELVAARVAAKVIVIVQQQHPGGRVLLAVKIGRSQAADAGANHHQIVLLCWRNRLAGWPLPTPCQLVRLLVGAGVAAAQAGERRRVRPGLCGQHHAGR